jgi:hypothetical protein
MIVMEKMSERIIQTVRCRPEAELVVDPTDITFDDLNRDTVMIRVKIRNKGERRSNPTFIRLESAPFGAFVPWRPLATLRAPALEPGESRELNVEAARPHPAPLGSFDRVPPMKVLTALNASPDERSPRARVSLAALRDLFRRRGNSQSANNTTTSASLTLPPDIWEYFGREQPHWAGNINVFVGDRAVERHVAKALRIYSGRTNLAMFCVGGNGKHDAYAFDLLGSAPGWKAGLYDATCASKIEIRTSDKPLQCRQWVEAATGVMLVILAVRPPVVCENGIIQVHVTRRSCQKTAVVEFDLDPSAQGAGCYTV